MPLPLYQLVLGSPPLEGHPQLERSGLPLHLESESLVLVATSYGLTMTQLAAPMGCQLLPRPSAFATSVTRATDAPF